MARVGTHAAERTAQNRKLVDEVSAELGRRVSRREAEQYRREQKVGGVMSVGPAPDRDVDWGAVTHKRTIHDLMRELVRDRNLDFEDDEVRYMGKVLGRVQDGKMMSGGALSFSVMSSMDFGHTITDLVNISRSHPLLLVAFEVLPGEEWEQELG